MRPVGGVFHQRADAQQAADALALAGVEPDELHYQVLPRSKSLANVFGPLGIPEPAIPEYERWIEAGDILLVVATEALPPDAIANEIARAGGLVVREGYYPAGFPGER